MGERERRPPKRTNIEPSMWQLAENTRGIGNTFSDLCFAREISYFDATGEKAQNLDPLPWCKTKIPRIVQKRVGSLSAKNQDCQVILQKCSRMASAFRHSFSSRSDIFPLRCVCKKRKQNEFSFALSDSQWYLLQHNSKLQLQPLSQNCRSLCTFSFFVVLMHCSDQKIKKYRNFEDGELHSSLQVFKSSTAEERTRSSTEIWWS